ncbi:MAG: class I tRNA ligase family protein, partial [Lachnospiraceae bacterium]|nr:class I tRNA ligase family protein [Lachnospiraceae bacterium]
NTVNWIPESIGKGRFGDWLENVQDWAVSRNRYWGTPLNIWECECGHQHCIGSIEELKEMSDNCPDDIELHRPYIDDVTIKCPVCGKEMHRVPEVIDCWYDSGSMPFAQYHYPFENQELFKAHFPADFISEAVDQTRGWFYSLMAISTLIFNQAPYKNVIVMGHVQDKDGQKMSKSKGNAVDPFDALNEFGADAIRWYFYTNSAPWLPNRFHGDAVVEGQRKFMGTLWNTYAFFVLYANIDQFSAKDYKLEPEKLSVMDKWILSKLNSLIIDVDNNMTNYKIPESGKALQSFVDDLSNWYVRRCRDRFWAKGMGQDKINAYMTLYTCLVTLSKVAAPFVPFITEDIYQNIVRKDFPDAPESIHLCDFPKADESLIDKELEDNMEHVLDVVVMGRACRNASGMKNRQPLANMFIKAPWEMPSYFTDIVADELNIKHVEMKDDVREFSSYSFKPQLKTVGPKFGKQVGEIRNALAAVNGNDAMDEVNATGSLKLALPSGEVVLEKDDLLIETAQVEGFESLSDFGITVVLDLHLTDDLIEEGFIRELVSKIQTMRKEADFEVMDMITIYISDNARVEDIVNRRKEMMLTDVMATDIVTGQMDGISKEWDINGEKVTIGVKKN